ncbi:hypothetical protein KUV51_08915 [Tateyamaria omphalii]|uniref:hypothetical protein n=1 Tax=Tateyamaria omphalii TaxID=299262 RepID=UPI001C9940A5|nr:hypothetical protein [Tateyamaria omphalii]MBY5933114.1 hypothetical protein [Tateyamaria omphalii]
MSKKTQARLLLLSWRSILNLSTAEEGTLTHWFDESLANGGILVTQASLTRASSHFPGHLKKKGLSPSLKFNAFVDSKLSPTIVIPFAHISMNLYSEIAQENEADDLELFAIACAIQNAYFYQCWDQEDVDFAELFAKRISVAGHLLKDV